MGVKLPLPLGVLIIMHIEGACHCGAISFTAEVDPSRVMVCHCTDCQILSGSPFRAVAPAPIETFKLQGEPRLYIKTAESGTKRIQAFCPACGTPLYSTAVENSKQVVLRLGSLKQRAELTPVLQIWQRSSLSWANNLSNIPGCQQQEGFASN